MHIGWSENAKLAKPGKKVCILPKRSSQFPLCVYTCITTEEESVVSSCDHKASAVFAVLKSLLTNLLSRGISVFSIISHFPKSQYINKKIFWCMSQFAKEPNVEVK